MREVDPVRPDQHRKHDIVGEGRAGDGKRAGAAEPAERAGQVAAVGVGFDEDGEDGVGGGVGAGGGVDEGVGGGEEGVGEEVGGDGGVAGGGGGVEGGGLGGGPSEEGEGEERVGLGADDVGDQCGGEVLDEMRERVAVDGRFEGLERGGDGGYQ